MTRLRAKARKEQRDTFDAIRCWWTRKYGLPSNHPAFLRSTYAEVVLAMLEDAHDERDAILDEIRTRPPKDSEYRTALFERLNALDDFLKEGMSSEFKPWTTGDPLVDKWEEQLARGEMPDLNEGQSEKMKKMNAERARQHDEEQAIIDQLIGRDSRRYER